GVSCGSSRRRHTRSTRDWSSDVCSSDLEGDRYGIDPAYVRAALAGESASVSPSRRSWVDWALVGGATATIAGFGMVARVPQLTLGWGWVAGLTAAMLALLAGTGWLLWIM